MRDMDNIITIDLHLDTQQATHNGVRTSIHLQTLLKTNPLENIIVRSAHRRLHDVGAWCFLGAKSIRLPKKVELALHQPERALPIQNLVSEVITMACSDKSPAGAGSKLADFAVMVSFCDSSGHTDFLQNPEKYQTALKEFTAHLRQSTRKMITQAKLQSVMIECGSYLFPLSKLDFSAGIERIQSIPDNNSYTKPPPAAPVKRFVGVLDSIFNELSDFILNENFFPHPVVIDGERAILTTEAYPFIVDSLINTKTDRKRMSPFVDYRTGLCKTWEEVTGEIPNADRSHYMAFSAKSKSRLETGNSVLHCGRRRRIQKLAHDSFVALFALNSGENESVIISTPWEDTYKISKESNGVRVISIKLRGGVQTVTFRVLAPFIKSFQKFIALRSHILDNEAHDKLFVGFDYRVFKGFRQLDQNIVTQLCTLIRGIVDPTFPKLSYMKLRAYKDSWVVKNYDHKTAATLLHHSEAVQRKSYTNVDEKEAIDRVVGAVGNVVKMLKAEGDVTIPSGSCTGASPTTSIPIPPGYEPDCKNSRGCLFCNEYRTTADAESIHKLYSLEYITKKFLAACDDLEQFNKIHQPALAIISKILEKITTLRPELNPISAAIKKQVYEKLELTEYWEKYLSRLIKIGAIR